MGHKCNSSYKLALDLLHDSQGLRRVAFDPYKHAGINLVLDKSDPFGGSRPELPSWKIRFDPDVPEVLTWDAVFFIRQRYQRDHLDEGYMAWLREFRNWARSVNSRYDTDDSLIEALSRFEQYCIDNGLRDRAFLKAAVFRMLRMHCEQGHDHLKLILRDLLNPSISSVAQP
jgi:hypothetical protein